ncbi:hypothetical protein [Halobacteriovorax sp.]|uniref:hypothetical protein n=1 Tax=Halobacteriovorax sp. TaxID=2020862 RepID=UPI003562F612
MRRTIISKFILISSLLLISSGLFAHDRIGRLGIGMSNQLKNDLPAISFKIQNSKSTAIGGLATIDTDENNGGWGAGFKLYRNIFKEPQLNFYSGILAAVINEKQGADSSKTGFQFDLTMGSEFSFTGLSSIGFSFEFGVSFNKINDFRIQTVGDSFLVAAAHFYL